jgi:hypothetical protein
MSNYSDVVTPENVGSDSNAFDLNSGGARFESQPAHRLSCLRVSVVFLSPSR